MLDYNYAGRVRLPKFGNQKVYFHNKVSIDLRVDILYGKFINIYFEVRTYDYFLCRHKKY